MRIVSIIEDKTYLLWQQEIQLLNLLELGQRGTVVVLYRGTLSEYAQSLSSLGDVFFFENDCPNSNYLPAYKPWGLYKLLSTHPEMGKDILLVDSDVYFRGIPEIPKEGFAFGGNCDSYLGYNYMKGHLTDEQIASAANGILSLEEIKSLPGSGAQYYFRDIDYLFCLQVVLDSLRIYTSLADFSKDGSKIQIWTAEMWSWLWNAQKYGGIEILTELDFSWATDNIEKYEKHKLLHIAGVVNIEMGLFYKGLYTKAAPWEIYDFAYITKKDNCGWKYLQEACRLKGVQIPQ